MQVKHRKPRLVLYGVGQFGQYVTRIAVSKGFPIVAAYNRSGEKVGKDLGRLAGLDREIGVTVQDCDTASYDNLDADIGIVMMTDRLKENFPAYERLMNAGLNLLCLGCESGFPFGVDKELAGKIDSLAKANQVTFSGSGIWDFSRIWPGIMIAGPCTEIRSIHHRTYTNAQNSGVELMNITGVGMTLDEYEEKIIKAPGKVGGFYSTIPAHVLHALGYTVTKITERREPVVFDEPYFCELLNDTIPPGICVGTRVIAEVETKEGVFGDAHMDLRLFKEDDTEEMVWTVDGDPSPSIRVTRGNANYATAGNLFNRIRDVIAAGPGIVLTSQMGPVRPSIWE